MNLLPIDQIISSPTNPRKNFDKTKLAELTESIRAHGLLQPCLVRPILPGRKEFELVAGERRWRAAKAAGLKEIPVLERELTDMQVMEFQVIENLQRDDLHPLEEAEGYEHLVKAGMAPSVIGERVGKTKSYINKTLQFLHLGPKARKAFLEGKLLRSTALLLARIPPGKDLQDRALEEITTYHGGGMKPKAAAEHIEENYMLRLKEAPFDPRDADLCPKAGPCSTCPKRTGNQKELFDDVQSADTCTDPQCYKVKVDTWWIRQKAQADAKGVTVLEGGAADRARNNDEYHDLKERAWELDGQRRNKTWEANLKEAIKLGKVKPVLARKSNGEIRVLVDAQEAHKALGLKPKWETSNSYNRQDRDRQKKKQLAIAVAARAVPLMLEKLRLIQKVPGNEILQLLAKAAYEHTSIDAHSFTAKRRGLARIVGESREALQKWLKQKHTASELQDFILELLCLQPGVSTWSPGYGASFKAAVELTAIDLKAIERELVQEKKTGKSKTAAPKAEAPAQSPSPKTKLKRQPGTKGGETSAAPPGPAVFVCAECSAEFDTPEIGICPECGGEVSAMKPATASPPAEAFHFTWNDANICTNPEKLKAPLPKGYTCEIALAVTPSGKFTTGYDLRQSKRSRGDTGGAHQFGPVWDTRAKAIGYEIGRAARFFQEDLKNPKSLVDAVIAWGKKLGAVDPAKATTAAETPAAVELESTMLKAKPRQEGPPFEWGDKGLCENPWRFQIPHRTWRIELLLANNGSIWNSGYNCEDGGVGISSPVRLNEAWPSREAAVNAAGEALLSQLRKWNAPAKTILAATAEIKRLRAGE